METMHQRCCGMDVHQATVVACVRVQDGAKSRREVRTFGTVTGALHELAEWLRGERVEVVAMEATGVYWKPVWHILEAHGLNLLLANAAQVKAVPRPKSDPRDARWLAELAAHGLVRGSFVPPEPVWQLRDLTRARKQIVAERTRHAQRLHKVLEDANIKVATVVTDILGKSGRAFLGALIAGEGDPEVLARLGSGRLKATPGRLAEALRGRVTPHHRFMLRLHLGQIDEADRVLAALDAEVAALLEPFRQTVGLVATVPGVGQVAAAAILAEIGLDMGCFPSAGQLVSWATLCPRSDESAGVRRSTRTRKGSHWLKPMLVQAAWCAVRTKHSHERALFLRLKSRRGPQKAVVAVAASMLRSIYCILRDGVPYRSPGPDPFNHANRERAKTRLVRRLRELGFQVEVREKVQ